MFTVRLAELNIAIDNKYKYIEDMCKDYIVDDIADFTVTVTEDEIKAEANMGDYTPGYLESLAVYRKIANKIIEYDGFLLHGVVISIDNTGIAFCARSGVGKTTHTMLWKNEFGKKCLIVNGDKPLIRIIEGIVYAYGTPWAGKEGFNENIRTQLKKVCFLKRGEFNEICRCKKKDALEHIMSQVFIPQNGMKVIKTMDLIDKFIKITDIYILKCTIDVYAVKTAYDGMLR